VSNPLDIFRRAVEALEREDWVALARCCDPVSLARFRRDQLQMLEPTRPVNEVTVEQLLRHDPEMPREVAEYQVANIRRHRESWSRLEQEFPGVSSLDAMRSMDPAEVFATWLRGRSPAHQARIALRDRQTPAGFHEDILAATGFAAPIVTLGVVHDGERVAHVLFRREYPMPHVSEDEEHDACMAALSHEERELARELAGREFPHVATCRRQPDGEWRLIAGFDFLQMGRFVVSVDMDDDDDGAAP
jgi:hypothetical protein